MTGTEEMANGNDVNRMYADAVTAQLGERVTNLGRRQTDLEAEMRSGFKQMETSITGIAAEMRSSIAALSTNLAERNQTHWPLIFAALSVVITILAGLGFLSLQPIKDNVARLEDSIVRVSENNQAALSKLAETTQAAIKSVVDNMVTQKEMEWRTARGAEDRKRSDDAMTDLRASTVSRNEWSERNHARDGEIAELGRRIDEIRQEIGSQYTTRDVLLSTQSEVKDLRNQMRRLFEARLEGRAQQE
ncbi:hypothetical protein AB3480_00365 [Rhizobium mongolense]|uniref:hypothetical protein n=1 Tax=Rhizobium mongolense TaxID=57676 RepID=UPI0034A30D04